MTDTHRRSAQQEGFTLVELLVVIVVIAILATIAIPTFFGQRQHAQDAAAYTLVRNALTAFQGAFVDTPDYTRITPTALSSIEPSIHWVESDTDLVEVDPAWMAAPIPASATRTEVAFFAESATTLDLASVSESGNAFGIQVNVNDVSQSDYVKVKLVEGQTVVGW